MGTHDTEHIRLVLIHMPACELDGLLNFYRPLKGYKDLGKTSCPTIDR